MVRAGNGEPGSRRTDEVDPVGSGSIQDGRPRHAGGGNGARRRGKIVFQALATISYDDPTSSYRFRAYNNGHYLDTELKVTPKGFEWGYAAGPLKVNNVMRINEKGEWAEVTESAYGGTPPRKSVEMSYSASRKRPGKKSAVQDSPGHCRLEAMPHVLRITALACAAVLSAPAADNQLTAEEKAAGWRLMFDGKTYAGWEDPTKKVPPSNAFTIEDGCIKSLPHPNIDEDLFTKARYRDFEMEFDWKISPGGNSGVKYRIQDRVLLDDEKPGQKFEDRTNASMKNRRKDRPAKGQEYVIGFEYQVLDNEKNPDARRGTNHQAGALYDMISPSKDATKPVGEFNHSRLVVKGDAVEHWLNGVKVVDGSLNEPGSCQGHRRAMGYGFAGL